MPPFKSPSSQARHHTHNKTNTHRNTHKHTMCILHIPVHPWCTCLDPSTLNPHTKLPTCPHHI
jgi:hypothetical protein